MAVTHLRKWKRADAVVRASKAWDLRTQGLTWDEIAEACEYASATTACRSVHRWRSSLPAVDLGRMRDEAIGRLGWLLRRAYEDVEENRPGAVTAAVRVEGRLAELVGMDAPKHTISETYEQRVAGVFTWLARTDDEPPPLECRELLR